MSVLDELVDDECKLQMTSMIDVTFLLLIFFILTLKFKILEGKLAAYLPKDVGVNQSDAPPIENVEIAIRVIKEGDKVYATGLSQGEPWQGEEERRFMIKPGSRVLKYTIGPTEFKTPEDVRKELTRLHRKDDTRPATIDSRPGTYYADVAPILDAAIESKFTSITFVGEYKTKK